MEFTNLKRDLTATHKHSNGFDALSDYNNVAFQQADVHLGHLL